jgi:Domain of unknown function (DUF4440)
VKRCPTCNRAFDDETLSFCLEDGTPLVRESASRADSQPTLVSPSPAAPPPESLPVPATQAYGQLPGKATVDVSQFNPPAAQAYAPAVAQRRKWPWVVAILAIILLVIGGIVIAAVVIPPLLRNDNRAQPTPTPPNQATKSSSTESAADVPDDEDEVLAQLTKLENEWTTANVNGDKQALEKILADEYSGGADSHTKREYIDSLTPDPSIKSWTLQDLTVDLTGDRATMRGTLQEETTKGPNAYAFADTFVWRDRRWQAVASHTRGVK